MVFLLSHIVNRNDAKERLAASSLAVLTGMLTYMVAHDLPALGTQRQQVEAAWGTPGLAQDHALLYSGRNGLIAFCLDHNGLVQTIVETQEVDFNAVAVHCKPN